MITVNVNGEIVSIDGPMSIERLLATVQVPTNYLAVELNAEVVMREDYAATLVFNGDDIELVTLVGGG